MGGRLFLLGLCLVASCAAPPDVRDVEARLAPTFTKPVVQTAGGPLSEARTRALLARLDAGESDMLARHLAVEQAVAEQPLIAGNRVRFLQDGPAAFAAIFEAIRGARDHVNLEYFIFEDVEFQGTHLGDLLIAKRREGVRVNLLYDAYGSMDTPAAFFARLKQAGVQVVAFNPLGAGGDPNIRDHRKILVVDGRVAILGGINLSTRYQSRAFPKWKQPDDLPAYWRDTDIALAGPATLKVQDLFVAHWTEQHGLPLTGPGYFPPARPEGGELVRIIGSAPSHALPRYYVTLVSAIRSAAKQVWISTAYFVPTSEEREGLEAAARRGVDVRLFVPSRTDSDLALHAQQANYEDLLESGVRIYEIQDAVLHAKTALVDGVWSAVGSSNFDHRSALFNDEVDAVVLGRNPAGQLETMFREDLQVAQSVDLARWKERPLSQRIKEQWARIWASML